jgi:lipoprotein-anchoring transpeptidase ErfK/SrfK
VVARAGKRGGQPVRWAAGLAAVLALAAGCTGTSTSPSTSDGGGPRGGQQQAAPAKVTVAPAKGATKVSPADPVVVTAEGGILTGVNVTGPGGEIRGNLNTGKTTWTSRTALAFSTRYTVSAEATNATGQKTTATSAFTTVTATRQVFPAVSPLRGTTVGVGMPIRVYFDAPVTDRKAAVAHMKVTTSVPTLGAWRWFSDSEVHWRPRDYWKGGAQVALDTDLFGVKLGDGVYGGTNADRHIEFTIGRSQVSVADARSHQMTVYVNGRPIRTMPVSMGRDQYPTKGGPHVVIDKNRVITMDSRTFGLALDAGGYRARVEFATRISNNGEFVHSAPWSVAQQGQSNVSHGCINLSPQNAAWFFGFAHIGDVVDVRGTPRPLGPKDGDIYDWAIPWNQWRN